MEKENTKIINNLLLKIINCILFALILFNAFIILRLYLLVTFFPILFLFSFCLIIAYPLFLRFVLQLKWSECTKDETLAFKHIMIPYLIMELAVLSCYPHETTMAIDFWQKVMP